MDESPIIQQDITCIEHTHNPKQPEAAGRDIEAVVLSRAVRQHSHTRVPPLGQRTVVLR